MQFVCLIYTSPDRDALPGSADYENVMQSYRSLVSDMRAANVIRGGDELGPARDATLVRVRAGKANTERAAIDGLTPQLSGYFLIDVADQREAEAWAARIPGAAQGWVEVRPVVQG